MITAIVLAAGRSERMATQKLLLPFRDSTIVATVVDRLLECELDELLVVVGRDRGGIERALEGRPVTLVDNPNPTSDMLASVRCGIVQTSSDCVAVLIALGDQPELDCSVIRSLAAAQAATRKGIAVPVHQQRRGHPVLISTKYRDEILTGYDQVGLRGLMRAHADDVVEVPVPTGDVLTDIDTPEDYQRLRQRWSP